MGTPYNTAFIIVYRARGYCDFSIPTEMQRRFWLRSTPEVLRKYMALLDLQGSQKESPLGYKIEGVYMDSYYIYNKLGEIREGIREYDKGNEEGKFMGKLGA